MPEGTTESASSRPYEDTALGQTPWTGAFTVEPDMIPAFAAEFDPRPFHPDRDAARASPVGGQAAGGWHTAALTMRRLVEGDLQILGGSGAAKKDRARRRRPW
jgi:acyl dehydratase